MASTPAPCEFAPEHPIIERRLRSLEEWREGVEKDRMDDYKGFTKMLGEVHEKVNTVAMQVTGIVAAHSEVRSDRSGWVAALSAVTAVGSLIYSISRK